MKLSRKRDTQKSTKRIRRTSMTPSAVRPSERETVSVSRSSATLDADAVSRYTLRARRGMDDLGGYCQYRLPLEMGSQTPPTAQRTVTGAGCTLLRRADYAGKQVYEHIYISHGTIGRVVDLGITDAGNMGAAMAPAAADTLCAHLQDTGRTLDDYDLIITGDLGSFGSTMFCDLCMEKGIKVAEKHLDCGKMIFDPNSQQVDCGGSGCGCSASVLNGYFLKKMEEGDFNRAFFMATGALLSPTATMQNDSIPGIAHGVVLQRRTI